MRKGQVYSMRRKTSVGKRVCGEPQRLLNSPFFREILVFGMGPEEGHPDDKKRLFCMFLLTHRG